MNALAADRLKQRINAYCHNFPPLSPIFGQIQISRYPDNKYNSYFGKNEEKLIRLAQTADFDPCDLGFGQFRVKKYRARYA